MRENGFDRVFIVDVDWGLSSVFRTMDAQLNHLSLEIEQLKQKNGITDFNLVCHSQGAVLCRAYLQLNPGHTAQSFVSLAGPHLGQFGLTGEVEQFLPGLRNMTRQEASRLLYKKEVQSFFAVANYWRDPFRFSTYRESVPFLTRFNNESVVNNEEAVQYRSNFMKLKRAVFLGSSVDEIIEPPTSSLFEYWSTSSSVYEMVPMEKQEIYTSDLFGLKTMVGEGRARVIHVPQVTHMDWMYKPQLCIQYVLPFLV